MIARLRRWLLRLALRRAEAAVEGPYARRRSLRLDRLRLALEAREERPA